MFGNDLCIREVSQAKTSPKLPLILIDTTIELEATFDTITTTSSSYPYSHIYIHEPKQKVDLSKHLDTHQFVFDDAFDEKADNRLVYDQSTRPIVDSFLAGGRATFFAYGMLFLVPWIKELTDWV